jgi:hypothetical protein
VTTLDQTYSEREKVITKFSCSNRGRVANPFAFFLLTNAHSWMIPLQYVNAEELVWLFRVPDPLVWKGRGFDFSTVP